MAWFVAHQIKFSPQGQTSKVHTEKILQGPMNFNRSSYVIFFPKKFYDMNWKNVLILGELAWHDPIYSVKTQYNWDLLSQNQTTGNPNRIWSCKSLLFGKSLSQSTECLPAGNWENPVNIVLTGTQRLTHSHITQKGLSCSVMAEQTPELPSPYKSISLQFQNNHILCRFYQFLTQNRQNLLHLTSNLPPHIY